MPTEKVTCGVIQACLTEKKDLDSHLLGGKDVSLVVTVSVITRKRQ